MCDSEKNDRVVKPVTDGEKFIRDTIARDNPNATKDLSAYDEWLQAWSDLKGVIVETGMMDYEAAEELLNELSYLIPYDSISTVWRTLIRHIHEKEMSAICVLEAWKRYKSRSEPQHDQINHRVTQLVLGNIPEAHIHMLESLPDSAHDLPPELEQYHAPMLHLRYSMELQAEVERMFGIYLHYGAKIKALQMQVSPDYPPERDQHTPDSLSYWFWTAWGHKVSAWTVRNHWRLVQEKKQRGGLLYSDQGAQTCDRMRITMSNKDARAVVDSIWKHGHVGKRVRKMGELKRLIK